MLKNPQWDKVVEANPLCQVYSDAAAAIENHGHAQFKLTDSKGRLCLMGAINYVTTGDACDYGSYQDGYNRKFIDPLRQFTDGLHPINWNNQKGRSKEEVVGMLRKAATVL